MALAERTAKNVAANNIFFIMYVLLSGRKP
jgi:hypothetical protein